jgi:hypothetical protein
MGKVTFAKPLLQHAPLSLLALLTRRDGVMAARISLSPRDAVKISAEVEEIPVDHRTDPKGIHES